MSLPNLPIPQPIPSRFPLVLARTDDEAATPILTATACYPEDGPMGSVTFETPTNKARGALFLTSQNGNDAETINEADILAAINAVLGPPKPQPTPPPSSVTRLQFRRALNALGLRGMVEAALASAPQDARDAWDCATEVRRDDATLNAMAAALGLSPTQIDDLFILAASYE